MFKTVSLTKPNFFTFLLATKRTPFVFLFLLIFASNANAIQCNQLETLDSKETVSGKRKSKVLSTDRLVDSVHQFIQHHRRAPTLSELAMNADITEQQLETHLLRGQGVTKRAQRSAIAKSKIYDLAAIAKQKHPGTFTELEKKYAELFVGLLSKQKMRMPTVDQIAELLEVQKEDVELLYGASKGPWLRVREHLPEAAQEFEGKIVKAFLKVIAQTNATPTMEELARELKIFPKEMEQLISEGGIFANLADLKRAAVRHKPKAFENYMDLDLFTEEYIAKVMQELKRADRFVVVSAVAGRVNRLNVLKIPKVNEGFLKALLKFSKANGNAPIIVRPVNGQTEFLDPILYETPGVYVVPWEVNLESMLKLNSTRIRANQIKPLTSMDRIGKKGQRQILASPKSDIETLSTDAEDDPHVIYSTGALTEDAYVFGSLRIEEERLNSIAEKEHYFSALVLEKTFGQSTLANASMSGLFHVRRVVYSPEAQGFSHLESFYPANGPIKKAQYEAIAIGDIHEGETDRKIIEPLIRLISRLKVKIAVLHDIFNGTAVSHWDAKDVLLMIRRFENGELDLERELAGNIALIQSILLASPDTTILIPAANHNHWLYRWLSSKEPIVSEKNAALFFRLRHAVLSEKISDPYAWYIQKHLPAELLGRVKFSEIGQSIKVGTRGTVISKHGHLGSGGGKPSFETYRKAADNIAYGHTHTLKVHNGVANVGTTTPRVLEYTEGGFSNWVPAVSLIDQHGLQQPLEFRAGEWFRENDISEQQREEFFQKGFPNISKPDTSKFIIIDFAQPN